MLGCYLIGAPGAGKSTLMQECLLGLAGEVEPKPFAHVQYRALDGRLAGVQLGAPHELFPGTDRLSMAVQPDATAWVQGAPAPIVIGEGDRLATLGFLTAMAKACDGGFTLLWLDAPDDVARARSSARGTRQNEAWQKGRRSKVHNLVRQLPHVQLDAEQSVAVLAEHALAAAPALVELRARAIWAGSPG